MHRLTDTFKVFNFEQGAGIVAFFFPPDCLDRTFICDGVVTGELVSAFYLLPRFLFFGSSAIKKCSSMRYEGRLYKKA